MRIWLLALCLCWLPLAVLGAKAHPGVGLPWYSSQCPTDFPRKVNCAYGAFPYACFQDYSQDTSSCCECITSTSCTACVSSSKCNEYSRKCEGRTPFNRVLLVPIILGPFIFLVGCIITCRCRRAQLAKQGVASSIALQNMPSTTISSGSANVVVGAAYNVAEEEEEAEDESDVISPVFASAATTTTYAQPIYDNSAVVSPSAYQGHNPTVATHYYNAAPSDVPSYDQQGGNGGAGQTNQTIDPHWHEGYAE